MSATVYLDHAAGSPPRPEVVAAMAEVMARPGNPSSPHAPGRHARELLERSRRELAARLGVATDRVVFTAGGTEANNLALLGLPGPRLVSTIEHASVLEADPTASHAPVDPEGVIDLVALERLLTERRPRLVALMLANNETGAVQPVREAARLVHAAGALLHCDAVQAFGKIPAMLPDLGVDTLSVSAHKLGGPPGVGALVLGPEIEPTALLRGGGQESRRRAGTPNLPGIVGFATALDLGTDWDAIANLRVELERGAVACRRDALVLAAGAPRLPSITCLATPGRGGEVQLMTLDLAGIGVGIGAACSSGRIAPSHVLSAMGLPSEVARCAIRISLGWNSTAADVAAFLAAWRA
ncbi:MAG: cysteine desulfurase family protein [Geminicoccaceae bacterium]